MFYFITWRTAAVILPILYIVLQNENSGHYFVPINLIFKGELIHKTWNILSIVMVVAI